MLEIKLATKHKQICFWGQTLIAL